QSRTSSFTRAKVEKNSFASSSDMPNFLIVSCSAVDSSISYPTFHHSVVAIHDLLDNIPRHPGPGRDGRLDVPVFPDHHLVQGDDLFNRTIPQIESVGQRPDTHLFHGTPLSGAIEGTRTPNLPFTRR